jgi:hypothetical protein
MARYSLTRMPHSQRKSLLERLTVLLAKQFALGDFEPTYPYSVTLHTSSLAPESWVTLATLLS